MSENRAELVKLLKSKPYLLLWTGMLVSSTGTMLMLVVLSAKFFINTQSSLVAGAVFAAQWILPVVLFPVITYITTSYKPKYFLFFSEMLSAIVTLFIGYFFVEKKLTVVFLFLSLRGFLEAVTKSGRFVALKKVMTSDLILIAASTFNTSYFLGALLGGILGVFLSERYTVLQVAVIDSISFLVAASLYFFIDTKRDSVSDSPSTMASILKKGFQEVLASRPLLLNFFYLSVLAIFFQGYHNIARTYFPLKASTASELNVQLLQVTFSIAIVLGAFLAARYTLSLGKLRNYFWVIACAVIVCLLSFVLSKQSFSVFLTGYFIFGLIFEVAFALFQSRMVAFSSVKSIGFVSSLQQVVSTAGMALCVFLLGMLIDSLGILRSTLLFLMGLVTIVFIFEFYFRRRNVL